MAMGREAGVPGCIMGQEAGRLALGSSEEAVL